MAEIEVVGRKLEINEEGFLLHPDQWDEEVARILAREEEGLDEMTDEHWAVIR